MITDVSESLSTVVNHMDDVHKKKKQNTQNKFIKWCDVDPRVVD